VEENRIVCVGLVMYREWKEIELYVLVWSCTESGRKENCMCWFGYVQRMEENRIPRTVLYRGADKSLVRPRRKLATATEDFDVHISYL
jgi:hypothetical protein